MAAYDLSIRAKLAIFTGVGVLLVAGMLAEQQFGDHWAALERSAAGDKELIAVEALRAADDLGTLQVQSRELRLAIAAEHETKHCSGRTLRRLPPRGISRPRSLRAPRRPTRGGSKSSRSS